MKFVNFGELNDVERAEFEMINEFFKLRLIHMYFINKGNIYPPLMMYDDGYDEEIYYNEYIEFVMDKFNEKLSYFEDNYDINIKCKDHIDMTVDVKNKNNGIMYVLGYSNDINEIDVKVINGNMCKLLKLNIY